MAINQKRRLMLKTSLAASVAGVAASAGLLVPARSMAAWPHTAFDAKSINAALSSLLGSATLERSSEIKIKAPTVAENGAVVNIVLQSTIADAESVSILVAKNATPLAFSVDLAKTARAFIKTRIKISSTSDVTAVVKANGKLYSATRLVKVTVGGCGG